MKLEDEIKSKFESEYHKLGVNIIYTQYYIQRRVQKLLKPFGLTNQQYNVLRILRGQQPNPANINLIIDRMLDKMSNASRLVDKLQAKGLVDKKPNAIDKRNADVSITEKGLALLDEIHPYLEEQTRELRVLSIEEAEILNALLEKVRVH
ncbi:MarR family transcriptional regulator [bacterium]|nr:MarR family transcriptional regulator [bacterium]